MSLLKKIAFAFFLTMTITGYSEIKQPEKITIEINFICPQSEELDAFKKSIPDSQAQSVDYEDFQKSFVENMKKLIELVESGKVNQSNWSVKID